MSKENSGALFKNNDKKKETQPDFRGNITIDGKDYQLSAWKRISKAGVSYISLQASTKQDFVKKENKTDFLDDDIGF